MILLKRLQALALLSAAFLIPSYAHGTCSGIVSSDNSLENDTAKVYTVVEVMPEYPGGSVKMYDFINENLQYPENIADYGYGARIRVVVQFVVDRDGSVCNAKVIRGKDPVLDAEALRVVGLFPKFIPGSMEGRPVKVRFVLPVIFNFPEAQTAQTVITGCGTPEFVDAMAKIWHYPEKALKKGIMGTVYVTFDVDADGSHKVINTKAFPDTRKSGAPNVQKKDIQLLIDEAVRTIGAAVAIVGPAKVNGEPFSSRFLLPVRFQIDGKPYVKADYTPMAPVTILQEVVVTGGGAEK